MRKEQVLSRIHELGIVAVVRTRTPDQAFRIAEALYKGGISAIEITFTVPRALETISALAASAEAELVLGAGTVLDGNTAAAAIDAGACFVVGPGCDPEVIATCRRRACAVIPGALTPTEIIGARRLGADIVKVFPCGNVGGAQYIKALRGPLPDIPLLPTGGIDVAAIPGFLKAGAVAVGVGSTLIDPRAVADEDWAAITRRAQAFVAAVRTAREG